MQTILTVIVLMALIGFLILSFIKYRFLTLPKTDDILDECEADYEDDEDEYEDKTLDITNHDDYLDSDYEPFSLPYLPLDDDSGEINDIQPNHEQANACAVSQIEGYYETQGIADMAHFLVYECSSFSKHKYSANRLLRLVISYVRYISNETRHNLELIMDLLQEAEKDGSQVLAVKLDFLQKIKMSHEQNKIFDEMQRDFSEAFLSGLYSEANNDAAVNLAIESLLPYASGYTLIRKGTGFAWKLTNINKNIVATARQREWQRQMLITLERIEDSIDNISPGQVPHKMEV